MEFSADKCPICYEPFNSYKKPYILLICGHTFCNPCINQIKKECLEDTEKYITLKEFYNKQKKRTNLCDSEVSLFSDNCRKKSSFSSFSSINKEKDNENLSKESDSYDEVEEKEENEVEKENGLLSAENKEENKSEKSKSFGEDNNDFEDEEEESDEKNEDEEDESSNESNENDDNSEKSFNNINDIVAINENDSKREIKMKKIFKFKCPFCSVRIKITDKELIINENILKINEIANNENDINSNENNNKNKYFCELCNKIVEHHNHYEKFGNEHNKYLFELNKNLFERAFNNLNQFNSSKDDIILKVKEFLNDFNQNISENEQLISTAKNNFIKYCKYNSRFISVLKKTKQKLEILSTEVKKKKGDKNLNLKEKTKLLENIKSFNQLINGVFYFPQLKMKLISEKSDININSNLYFEYSFKETYNQYLENGFFHFLRNKLFKTESKYIPFYCSLTKRNFLYNSELNVLIKIKIAKKYSNTFYESSSDGSLIYGFYSKKKSKSSEFFSFNIHLKKIKRLENIPLTDYKKLDTIMYNDIKLFVIGGLDKYNTAITSCFYYNIKINKWEKMPKLKYNRYNKALYIYGRDLIVFGGKCEAKDSSYIFEKIDLGTLKNWESFTVKNFSANIYNFGYCAYSQDIIFIVGGEDQVTEDYIKKGYIINLKEKSVIEEFDINDVLENNVHTPKCYRGIILSTDKELYNIDMFNIWIRLHKLNMNLP